MYALRGRIIRLMFSLHVNCALCNHSVDVFVSVTCILRNPCSADFQLYVSGEFFNHAFVVFLLHVARTLQILTSAVYTYHMAYTLRNPVLAVLQRMYLTQWNMLLNLVIHCMYTVNPRFSPLVAYCQFWDLTWVLIREGGLFKGRGLLKRFVLYMGAYSKPMHVASITKYISCCSY